MRTRTALLACLMGLSPAAALAQNAGAVIITESSTSSQGGLSDGVINIAECDGTVTSDSLSLRWTLGTGTGGTVQPFYRVYASTAACPTSGDPPGESATNHELTNSFQSTGGSASGSMTAGLAVRADIIAHLTGITCAAAATINICVLAFDGDTGTAKVQNGFGASGSIAVDVAAPGQPVNVGATSGDGALTVTWTAGSGTATSWDVVATPAAANPALDCLAGGVGPVARTCSGSGTTSCRVTGLTNDACYSVTVQGFSDVDNPSQVSAAASGVPRPVEDFWERYQDRNGREVGGCQSGPASALALLALAALAPRLRRRRP